jgi:hypothetical protein
MIEIASCESAGRRCGLAGHARGRFRLAFDSELRFLASRPRFSIHSSSHVSDHLAFLMLAPHDHLDELLSESCGPSADAILSIKFRLLSINQSTRVNR